MLKNKDLILYNLIDYYFEESTLKEKDEIKKYYSDNTVIGKIFSLEINSNAKSSLILIFKNYDEIINLLIDSISNIYISVKHLHETNKKFISKFPIKENYLNILKDIFKVHTFDNAIYCVSLLKSYSCRTMHEIYFVLGNQYEIVLNNKYKFINVTFRSISNIFAYEINFIIINILYKYKKVCISEIEDFIPDYSNSTIYRAITSLYNEKVIERTENINGKYYYALNTDYFENAVIVSKDNLLYYVDKK